MKKFYTIPKPLLLALSLITLQLANGQCDKEISTDPTEPVNNEFLPMINSWTGGAYTVNPFLNTGVNWYPTGGGIGLTIPINLDAGWISPISNLSSNIYYTDNPFANTYSNYLGNESGFPVELRDFWGDDGWELLWINLGYFPNGDPLHNPSTGSYYGPSTPSPSNVPFFALYNRYRGTIRLFSNVWFDPLNPFRYSDVSIKFGFTSNSILQNRLSGLLRISGNYDLPLDIPSSYTETYSARKHPINTSEWHISEFQTGFDPCVCLRKKDEEFQSGLLEFEFRTFTELNIDMMSRTIETTQDVTQDNYDALDFLNLSNINKNTYEPGHAIYKRMNGLFEDYEAKLEKYEQDLADYNHPMNQLKKQLISMGKTMVTTGVASIPLGLPPAPLSRIGINSKAGYESANKTASNLLKGLVGLGYDYATFDINAEKPKKPTMPSANFAETFYKGTIGQSNSEKIDGLFIPGATTISPNSNEYGYGQTSSIGAGRFPAYNKVLGQVALLESPVVEFGMNMENEISSEPIYFDPHTGVCGESLNGNATTNLTLRITDALMVALNEVLDFDKDRTKTYVNIEVNLDMRDDWQDNPAANLYLSHSFPFGGNKRKNIYNSKWIPLDELHQYLFSIKMDLHLEDEDVVWQCTQQQPELSNVLSFSLQSIKIKLLHDMYFDQISPHGDQVNTTQVFTYLLYSNDGEGNEQFGKNVTKIDEPEVLLKYITGELILEDEHIDPSHQHVWEVQGNTIYINAENIIIKGQLTVEEGYELIIQSLYQIDALPQSNIGNNITLRIKKDWYDLEPFHYATEQEKYDFCNNTDKYQAGQISNKARERYQKEMEERALAERARPKQFRLYPNPASSEVQIDLVGQEGTAIEFIDTKGQTLMKTEIAGNTGLNIEQLSPGVYIVRVHYTDGSTAVQRLVKL